MGNHLVATCIKGDEVLEIHRDYCPRDPRENDNLGTMVCFHKRYAIGDKHDYNPHDFRSWEEVKSAIEKDNDVAVILPVYMYDHSGIALATTPFHCPWDSGQVGWIYATKEKIRQWFNVKKVTAKIKENAAEILRKEVEVYSNYINGDVYGFVLKNKNGDVIDSVWGFYGIDPSKNGILNYVGSEWKDLLLQKI